MFTEHRWSGTPSRAGQEKTGRKELKGRQFAGLQYPTLRSLVPCHKTTLKFMSPPSVLVQPYQAWPGTALSQRTPEMILNLPCLLFSRLAAWADAQRVGPTDAL